METILHKSHLRKTLSKLSLTLAEKADGQGYLAYTEAEPFFCIERDTEEALFEAIKEILFFYGELHGVNLENKLHFSPAKEVHKERIRPVKRFELADDFQRELSIA